ncbi:PTS fructose transporter subunit IIB [Sodalis sp. RH21]|uniref:PTS fructose transporter subunit IIB n=1 Tax=unclassified Sodalis (in: enterobacteria) TaxID=2636512 RepID=UPI0039B606A4
MSKKLIALCACPMGLAHTFMAAQALEDAAREAGYDEIKIETQGADGIQNRLTAEDIAGADIIIHAIAITPEDSERFEHVDVYEITLQDAIKNPGGTLREIEAMIREEHQK